MIPKNPGIAQKGTQKSGSNPQKVPKIMAHPRIMTYASYPPGGQPVICTFHLDVILNHYNKFNKLNK